MKKCEGRKVEGVKGGERGRTRRKDTDDNCSPADSRAEFEGDVGESTFAV